MITKAGLNGELMVKLCELVDVEENELKLLIAMYLNEYEKCRESKIRDFRKSIEDKIYFYGRIKDEYQVIVNELVQKYNMLIEKVIIEYNTRFIALMNEISDTQANQKISIANIKLGIEFESNIKKEAAIVKKSNYEIVLKECFRQLENCCKELLNKLNEIFYNKNNQLTVEKISVFKKIINIFTAKKNIQKFVFAPTEVELENLENKVKDELQTINNETIQNIAIIKDAQIQTQNVFNKMLEG